MHILITGATSGIGRATALEFARHGHHLVLTGRRKERLDTLKAEIEEQHSVDVLNLLFDIRDQSACDRAVQSLKGHWTEVDVLINNAGLAQGLDPIHEARISDWETMIDTNVKGLLYMTRRIVPHMVKRRSGHIINVCSTAGKEVYPNGSVYCATKHAVAALTKGMRYDLYKYGIRVSEVSPAHVEETEFAARRFHWDTEKAKIYEDFNPLTSKDVAEVIYFIASRPPHVNIQDVLMMGTQQASSMLIDRSGRRYD